MRDFQTAPHIGILHPGEMGAALAMIARANGCATSWASAGRSIATIARAGDAGVEDAGSLRALCLGCDVLVSICPPHAALDVAQSVVFTGFSGIYMDANAIAPATAREIAAMVEGGGARYVDAAVFAPPNGHLYLSGKSAATLAPCFASSALKITVLGEEQDLASAVKICHSAMHKGQLALLFATLAAAEHHGIRGEVEALWAEQPECQQYVARREKNVRRSAKGWRFAGEMAETARTFAEAGLPAGFHAAAGELFARLPEPGSGATIASIEDVLELIMAQAGGLKGSSIQ